MLSPLYFLCCNIVATSHFIVAVAGLEPASCVFLSLDVLFCVSLTLPVKLHGTIFTTRASFDLSRTARRTYSPCHTNIVRACHWYGAFQLLSALALATSARPVTHFTAHCLSPQYMYLFRDDSSRHNYLQHHHDGPRRVPRLNRVPGFLLLFLCGWCGIRTRDVGVD